MVERELEHYKIYWWTLRIFECVFGIEIKIRQRKKRVQQICIKGVNKWGEMWWVIKCFVYMKGTIERIFIAEIIKNLLYDIMV